LGQVGKIVKQERKTVKGLRQEGGKKDEEERSSGAEDLKRKSKKKKKKRKRYNWEKKAKRLMKRVGVEKGKD